MKLYNTNNGDEHEMHIGGFISRRLPPTLDQEAQYTIDLVAEDQRNNPNYRLAATREEIIKLIARLANAIS